MKVMSSFKMMIMPFHRGHVKKWLIFALRRETHLTKCSNVKHKQICKVLVCYLPG